LGLPLRPAALGRAIAQLAGLLGPAALRALVCRLRRPCSSPSAASLRSLAAASPPAHRKMGQKKASNSPKFDAYKNPHYLPQTVS